MNKRIKKIIALTVAFSAIMTIAPKTFLGETAKPAYAASYTAKNGELTSLTVKSMNGDKLSLKDGYNGDTVKLSDDKEYFVKLTDDSEGVVINAEAKGSDRIVRIFLTDDDDATAYKPGDKLYLGKGNTTVYVRTYASLSDFREAKDKDKDVSICEEEYKVNIKKTTESSYEDSTQDPVYLKNLSLNKGDITFLKQRTTYNVKVSSSVSEIRITAEPEDDSARVRIDGSLVDEDDNYKKTISLDKGKNEIKIKVTDSKDNQRVYTLNITRGSASDSNSNSDVNLSSLELDEADLDFSEDKTSYEVDVDEDVSRIEVTAEPEDEEYLVTINGDEVNSGDDYMKKVSLSKGKNTIKVVVEDEVEDEKKTYTITVNRGTVKDDDDNDKSENQDSSKEESNESLNGEGWVKVDGDWKYKDENGKFITNKWLYDKEQGVYCYLKEDGYRATGWLQEGGNWFLLDSKGAMLTGWQYTGGQWYYLQPSGEMKTGWLKEEKVIEDTTSSAEEENKTDAQNSSNTSVTDKTEAENSEEKKEENKVKTKTIETWYYLQSSGAMKTGWLLDGDKWYYMNLNGAMQTGWIIDNNSKYYLDKSGSMVTGTQTIEGKEYKFATNGALIS
ncbi:cadherin-like beta sandwich domain-containing protein [uncultured Clostridium sp.]|uniref:cadherin-like beta sandwich domain-containing protein n=1 Tax=uncultured Clostridium sp. TaxID=59620 RepID=UPI0025DB9A39|nr:cadherin-like beta sandwich domain-containing protein [uncultured Clostridium sp.]